MSSRIRVGSAFTLAALAGALASFSAACEDGSSSPATSFDAGPSTAFDASSDAGFPAPPDGGADDASSSDAATAADARAPGVAFFTDFEGPIPSELAVGTGLLTPTEGYATLGPAGRTFASTFLRSETGNVVTLTLGNLPAHTKISLKFLFAAIDSLDGTGTFPAGDFLRVTLDDTVVLRSSFANAEVTQTQDYVAPPGGELARRIDLGFQGPGGYYTDSAYDMAADARFQNLAHTAGSAVFTFTIQGEGAQSLDDESWAIDNLQVSTD